MHRFKGIFLIALACAGLACGLYIWTDAARSGAAADPTAAQTRTAQTPLMSKAELQNFDSSDPSKPIYLAIMGEVFDVTKGEKFYRKPNGGYSFFSGVDGSLAFVTGAFNETGLVDDVSTLTDEQLAQLSEWRDFYRKDYTLVARLVGWWYDANGQTTAAHAAVLAGLARAATAAERRKAVETEFPGCNIRRASGARGELWCTTNSGGIERPWTGVPREFYDAAANVKRCACVPADRRGDGRLKLYPGCASDSDRCWVD